MSRTEPNSDVHAMLLFFVEIEQFWYEFRSEPSHAQVIDKKVLINGDSTIGYPFSLLYKLLSFVIEELGPPVRSSSFTSSRPSVN